ncbi:MAG: flagellar hook-length control protein FliK [Syntrophales bacterium]|nr:flagellar hook-length control protein FliK [Syntrophales bacterium]
MKLTVTPLKGDGYLPPKEILPPLSVGEKVSVYVTGQERGKYLILIKGRPLEADSKIPLPIGEKITVRVQALEPKVVLVPVENRESSKGQLSTIRALLQLYRQEPDLLGKVLMEGQKILAPERMALYRRYVSGELLDALTQRFTSAVTGSTDVRSLAYNLGLFHERNLFAGGEDGAHLKSILLKIGGELENISMKRPAEVDELARWVSTTLSRIEACQVVNVLSRDREGVFFLPLPFLWGQELRVGEFYGHVKGKDTAKECRAWIFVNPPNLGLILIELYLAEERLSVLVRCEKKESESFLQKKIDHLQQQLKEVGYVTVKVGCTITRDLEDFRRDLRQQVPAYEEGMLQVTI